MTEPQIRFEDGAGYERMMGVWSRSAGQIFLDWLAPKPGLNWVDVGCGNGAFTELLVERCAPAEIEGIHPSEAQLALGPTESVRRFEKVGYHLCHPTWRRLSSGIRKPLAAAALSADQRTS
jgi:2-polyprenyl-3-methyl-5-hydroxy-6-metoxy-1,4-benzoquinol methylase